MRIVGLTGGIASGKSTAAAMLREMGAVVIDADQLAKEVVQMGQPAWYAIIDTFGQNILTPVGDIDRKKLGEIIFSDPLQRAKLNALVHPAVIKRFHEELIRIAAEGIGHVVFEVPLLIEAGLTGLVDEIWLVAIDEETQCERLMRRGGLTKEAAEKRISAQMSLKAKIKHADHVIQGNLPSQELRAQLQKLWSAFCVERVRRDDSFENQ